MKPNPRYAKGGGRSGRVVKTADYISACSDFALGHAWPVESEGGSVESDRKAVRLAFAQSTKSTENVAKQDAHLINTAVSLTDLQKQFLDSTEGTQLQAVRPKGVKRHTED